MSQRPYKDFYVATTGSLLSSGTTTDLAVGQFGFFDGKTWEATSAPSFNTIKELVIAQGTPDLSGMPEGASIPNVTFKVKVDGKTGKLINYFGKKSQRPQNMIVTLGFDGVDTTKDLARVRKGETAQVFLKLSGQPISNFYPDVPAGLKVMIPIGDTCTDECTDSCDQDFVSGDVLADQIINFIENYRIVGGQKLNKYVKATKLISCETPSSYVTVDYTQWTLTVADSGDDNALAAVQAQYPGVVIVRASRTGVFSTYEASILTSEGAPDNFDSSVTPVIPNCTSCPSGYTLVEETNVFSITRAGNVTAATINGAYSAQIVANSAVKLDFINGVSTFTVLSANDSITAITGDLVAVVGTSRDLCVLDGAPVEVPWTEGVDCTKATKEFTLTLKDACDGVTALAELQAIYGEIGTVTLVSTNSTFCTSQFKLTIESNNTLCPDCGDTVYFFDTPASLGNQPWIPVEQDVTGENCVYGVKFEGAYHDLERNVCTFEVPYFSDPIYVEVGAVHDASTLSSPCKDDIPVTTVQNIKFPAGYGVFVSGLEKQSKYYRSIFYNVDPLVRRYRQYDWNTNFQGYYDEVVLVFENEVGEYGVNSAFRNESFEVHFFLPEGQSTAFINGLNGWVIGASGGKLEPISL